MLRIAHLALLLLGVIFGLSAHIPQQAAAPNQGATGSVEGRVTVAGQPVAGLALWLVPRNEYQTTTETNADGRYRFERVPPEHYWVTAVSRRYVTSSQPTTWTIQGVPVSVAPGSKVKAADLDLVLAALLSGRAVDADGNAAAAQRVDLIQTAEPGSGPVGLYRTWCMTDDSGAFSFEGIPAGQYLVSVGEDIGRLTGATRDKYDFSRTGRVASRRYFEQTFWPGTVDKAKAEPVEVRAGSEVRDVNITVGPALPAFAVSGRVIEKESGKPVAGCNIGLGHRTPGGGYDYSGGTYPGLEPVATDDNGNFKFVGLIPGRFFLGADFPEGMPLFARMIDFEVQDRDVTGLEIKAVRGVTLSGAVSIEDTSPAAQAKLAQLKIMATSKFEGGAIVTKPNKLIYPSSQSQGSVAKDGSFRIAGLQSGEFEISISGDAEHWFSLVRIGYPKVAAETEGKMITARPQASSIPLILEGGDLNGVRVILAYRSSSIRGHVDIKGGISPVGKGLHAFADRTDGGRGSGVREIYADGDFLIDCLEPGEYRIFIDTIGFQTETVSDIKTVHLGRDTESRVSFVIDLSGKK